MDLIVHLLREQPQLLAFIQIFLDLALLVFFLSVLLRRPKVSDSNEELRDSLERIVQQTETIAREFDANLQDRREIINQVVSALDGKISEAKRLYQNLDTLRQTIQASGRNQTHHSRSREDQEILQLAQKGLSAPAIAERLKKPLGEIELVLSLKRLTLEH